MSTIASPPKGSAIRTQAEFDGITLSWKRPTGGPFRFFVVAFLIFWLCGWVLGLVAAATQILAGRGQTFVYIWLAMWTFAGVFVAGVVYRFLRPQIPESLTLKVDRFKYDTGLAPVDLSNMYWMMRRKRPANPLAVLWPKRKIYEFDRSRCPEFVLEGLGDDQRLRFDRGADRISVGDYLKEPEREWLAELLNRWRNG